MRSIHLSLIKDTLGNPGSFGLSLVCLEPSLKCIKRGRELSSRRNWIFSSAVCWLLGLWVRVEDSSQLVSLTSMVKTHQEVENDAAPVLGDV